jgi:tetratricopeptide (TPR) repeat protein
MGFHDVASEFLREGQRHHFSEPPNDLAAERAYRSATLAAPEWGEPYHWLAGVLESQGRTEEAVEAYQQAICLLPTDPRPLIALGRLQTACGHYAEAIRLLESGIAMKPHYAEADARLSLADALERSGVVEEAIAQWQLVMHMEPSYPSRHLPMQEAKRKLNEHGQNHPLLDDEKLVFAYLQHIETKDDQHFWAWEYLHNYISSDPRRAWEITLKLITAANNEALVYIATGPLEDLLYSRAEVFVDEVERLARTDPKFLSTLRLVGGPFTQELDAANRIQQAAGVLIRFIDDEWPSCEPKVARESSEE